MLAQVAGMGRRLFLLTFNLNALSFVLGIIVCQSIHFTPFSLPPVLVLLLPLFSL